MGNDPFRPVVAPNRHHFHAGNEDQMLIRWTWKRERGITIKAHPVTMLYQAKKR